MPSSTLTVYLYDCSNAPLCHPITIDLYDAASSVCLATCVSSDLKHPHNEWGGKLTFNTPVGTPVDIVFTDAFFEYPGNTLRYLNGDTGGRLDVDLRKVPTGSGGQPIPPPSANLTSLMKWVDSAHRWTPEEKEAVKQLIFNYCGLIVARDGDPAAMDRLRQVDENWGTALSRLGIPPFLLKRQ